MFNNLKAEMARHEITQYEIAQALNVTIKTISNKMIGKSEFTRKEMFIIKSKYFSNYSIDYLFDMQKEA